jgi:hypothetical protein
MTKAQKQEAELRAKPLFDFLDSYDARLISRLAAENGSAKHSSILLYIVNTYLVIVTVNTDGWDMFLPASKKNDVADTFTRAEEFLGPRPGDGHLQGEEWKQFAEAK